MKPTTVWFNRGSGDLVEVIRLLRAARRPGEFRILCTHAGGRFPAAPLCDAVEREPRGLGDSAYVAYCLDMVRRRRVGVFCPGRHRVTVARRRHDFERLGVRLLVAADADTLELLHSKARLYRALAGGPVPVPGYAVVNDLAGFDAAYARLRRDHAVVCYKPAVGIFGIGFRIVSETRRTGGPFVTLAAARRRFAAQGRFPDLLVMQYLPGPERSVDCLARGGELLRCVVRRKSGNAANEQQLEDNPTVVHWVRQLTGRFQLTHLYNVQFRDAGGVPYLLEINPRMSGGLPMACQSGLVLPYWAIRLALGTATPEEVPWPQTGLSVFPTITAGRVVGVRSV